MANCSPLQDAPDISDAALLTRSTPLDRLVHNFSSPLTSFFAKRVRARHDVEDLVQEVFLRLSAHPRQEAIQNPESYVFQIAANLLRDRARRDLTHHRNVHEMFEDAQHGLTELSPERVMLAREELIGFIEALDALPEQTRNVFVLYRLDGWRHAEIAKAMGMTKNMVWKHMMKAVAHLHRCSARRGE